MCGRPRDGDNEASILFPNGSRIVEVPGTEATVRGSSAVALLVIDEASGVSDDLYHALKPMLAVSNGTMWLMSTPWGQQGFFYETWFKGGPDWERVSVRANECARISKEFPEEARATSTRAVFEREFCCGFEGSGSGVFNMTLSRKALRQDLKPLSPIRTAASGGWSQQGQFDLGLSSMRRRRWAARRRRNCGRGCATGWANAPSRLAKATAKATAAGNKLIFPAQFRKRPGPQDRASFYIFIFS